MSDNILDFPRTVSTSNEANIMVEIVFINTFAPFKSFVHKLGPLQSVKEISKTLTMKNKILRMLSLLHPIQKSHTNTPHFMTATQKNADTELAFNSDAIFYFDSVEGRSSFKSSNASCVVQTPTERHSPRERHALLFHPKAWFSTYVVDRLYEYVVYKRCVSRISCCLFLSA